MKILVTGATGFIGTQVLEHLAATDHHVRALVRRPSRAQLATRHRVEAVHGDLTSPSSIDRAVDGVDAIIHLGGRATFEPYDRLRETIVGGTEIIADAAVRHGVERIAFGSSAFVYGGGTPIDDTTAPAPVLDYGRAKVDAERALEPARRAGITVASIRLPHVYGPQSLLFGLVRRRIVPFPGNGRNRFAQLHVDDAARVLVRAIEHGWDGTAPVADAATPTWNEFFEILQRHAPRVKVLQIPRRLALLGATVTGPALGRLGATMVAPDTIRGWNLDVDVVDAGIWNALDIEPLHATVESGIPTTLDGVVAFRWRHPINDFS